MGLLYVRARRARGLKKVQRIGRQKPYMKLWAGSAGTKVKTSSQQEGGSDPVWGEMFMFDIHAISSEEYLCFEVKNKNLADRASVGMGKVPLRTFGATMMETWYSIYDEKGKESGEVLLEAKVEETGRDVQGAYMSHGGPLLSRQNPNSTSASYHAPSTSMSAKLPNFRRHSYSALNASPNVFHHGERRSMQTIPNTNAVHHSDASTYSSGRSLDSSGVSVGIGEGWASVTSSTRMDADDQRLPAGWEQRVNSKGRTYYVNHT